MGVPGQEERATHAGGERGFALPDRVADQHLDREPRGGGAPRPPAGRPPALPRSGRRASLPAARRRNRRRRVRGLPRRAGGSATRARRWRWNPARERRGSRRGRSRGAAEQPGVGAPADVEGAVLPEHPAERLREDPRGPGSGCECAGQRRPAVPQVAPCPGSPWSHDGDFPGRPPQEVGAGEADRAGPEDERGPVSGPGQGRPALRPGPGTAPSWRAGRRDRPRHLLGPGRDGAMGIFPIGGG